MKVASYIQTAIHVLEAGAGYRFVRLAAILASFVALLGYFDVHCYRNFASLEAMDTAQLARNLAEGKGYNTSFIRPFSVYLIQRHNELLHQNNPASPDTDFARIHSPHPDIANPPVYPLMLAGLLKAFAFKYDVGTGRFPPEFAIALLNQLFLIATVLLTFYLGRRIFDVLVGWLASLLVLGCEPLWQFSISGLSTNFLLLVFLAIILCVVYLEEKSRLYRQPTGTMFVIALTLGLLAGFGTLTRYSFGWIIIPATTFLILFTGQRGMGHALAAVAGFGLMVIPWTLRNILICGEPFGVAGYLAAEQTQSFPDFYLEQQLHPTVANLFILDNYIHKLLTNLQPIVVNDLAKLGGSWTGMLFLTGLLMSFRGFAARRLRYFLMLCLATFMVVEAVGRTARSDLTADINSENLIILLVPMILIYSVVFFLQFAGGTHSRGGFMVNFLEKQTVPVGQLRYVMAGFFTIIACLPMIYTLLGPKASPFVYPPYYPPDIQKISGWMKEDELIMSDVPWAVAWYGRHQCIWVTGDAQEQFYALNDYLRPVQAIFLTAETMDGKMFTGMHATAPGTWTRFSMDLLANNLIPQNFPLLHVAPSAIIPSGLFLTDHERWTAEAPAVAP